METRLRHGSLTAVIVVTALIIAIWAATASASEPNHPLGFDPELSLTGGCTTSGVDTVPDPGCPGGDHPPAGSFSSPQAVATDSHGDIYVASYGSPSANGGQGRIDVFDPAGRFLTEIPDPSGPKSLALDSKGNLYVFQFRSGGLRGVDRYSPSTYEPAAGEIAYGSEPVTIIEMSGFVAGLAVNPTDEHLFVHQGFEIREFSSAEEGNEPLDAIGVGVLESQGLGLAIDSARGRIYASDKEFPSEEFTIDVFELASPHNLLEVIESKHVAGQRFAFEPSLAVNESTGAVFAYPEGKTVYELTESGSYLASLEYPFQYVLGAQIAFDNEGSGADAGYLFVPSHPTGVGHAFAFGSRSGCAPGVSSTSFTGVAEREVELRGQVEPCDLATAYKLEITTASAFAREGFEGANVVGEGELPPGASAVPVAADVSGLTPETEYRFRLLATNELGSAEEEGAFSTYPALEQAPSCPNAAFRNGFAAALPDCRAYELVTPGASNARSPRGVGLLGTYFPTREVSSSGDRVSFITEGGPLPGFVGTGSLGGDPYLSVRGVGGWNTSAAGPSGPESVALLPGSTSPDQGYSFWDTGGVQGSAVIDEKDTTYVRYPDGHSSPIGRGSLGVDPRALGKLISEGGGHIIFVATDDHTVPVQLEPNAPPSGTQAIYDRTADEVTHVVSLLPGNETPKAGEDAEYAGASLDGKGVAFEIGSTLYLRYDNTETYEIGEGITFAGIAEGGNRIFYLKEGKLLRFDALTREVKAFTASGTAIPVNVSADGSTAYFVSTSILTMKANPLGAKAKVGQQNLYLSREGAISFVGTVSETDVNGEGGIGLGLWVPHVASYGEAGEAASRTTASGNVLLFLSRADLSAYDSGGHAELYRYESATNELACLSCNPTGAAATGEASLESLILNLGDPQPMSAFGYVANLTDDGRRAFFQSTEALVPTDTDGVQDIYEWEAQGVGSCTRPQGCVFLISSGQSKRVNYLYGVSATGDDVFFRSSDQLLPADLEVTPSIYDARVGGGFPEEAKTNCEGEACRTALPGPPPMIAPQSSPTRLGKRRACPRSKHRTHSHGKVRCVRHQHHKHHRHRTAGSNKGGSK